MGDRDVSNERGDQPDLARRLHVWDKQAEQTAGIPCAEAGCLHTARRKYPGLHDDAEARCPIHGGTG